MADAHRGGLAGTVGAEQADHLTTRNHEVDAVECFDVPEFLDQAVGFDSVFRRHNPEQYARACARSSGGQRLAEEVLWPDFFQSRIFAIFR